jgi:hypothetical protein
MAGFCAHGNGPSGRLFFNKLSNYQLFKEYHVPRTKYPKIINDLSAYVEPIS